MPLANLDPLVAARLQFAASMTFHILFPAITIGLAWMLLHFRLRHWRTGREHWLEAYRFWAKVFALAFALGVGSGVALGFQFDANWPGFMYTAGAIARPLLKGEVLTAFLLEATFLGIMLFGLKRVSDRTHTLATFMVAAGTTLSAFWVLALDSWLQTPAGFEMVDGQVRPADWLAIIFNPSLPYRLAHTLLASGLTAAFLVAGLSAYRWRRGERSLDVAAALTAGIRLAAVLIPLQILVGELHGRNTLENQPAKTAAIGGFWQTQRDAPAILFAWPDRKARQNRYELSIPGLASLHQGHSRQAEVKGLDQFPNQHPPVAPVFWAFRVMVGVGLLMLAVSWAAAWQLHGNGTPGPWTIRALALMAFSGWIALVAGWYVTEVGRQPWLVQNLLATACAANSIPPADIGRTLFISLALYGALVTSFVAGLYYLARQAGSANARDASAELAMADQGGHA